MNSDRRFLIAFCFLMAIALFPAVSTVCADQIAIGFVSYDPYTDNLNTFSVNNFTGPFSLGTDFPVQTSLNFDNATLTLTESSGTVDMFSLGIMGPGTVLSRLFDPSLYSFTSAIFQGTLDPTTVSVLAADGVTLNTLLLNSNILVDLTPSLGNSSLQTGDNAVIYADAVTLTTPEPNAFSLVLSVFLLFSLVKIFFWSRRG